MTRLCDLTQPIFEGIAVYPGDPLFEARLFAEHDVDGFRASRYVVGSHLGTHIDAPLHYFVDGEPLESFPVDFFSGNAACLNFASVVGPLSSRYRDRDDFSRPVSLRVDDLAPFEKAIESLEILVLRVDWADRAGSVLYYYDFPSVSPELCDWLADFPKLRVLGLETPSLVAPPATPNLDELPVPDSKRFPPELEDCRVLNPLERPAPRETDPDAPPLDELELLADSEAHRILLGRRPPILILEGLVNLDSLPAYEPPCPGETVPRDTTREFQLLALPTPFQNADGAPARVVAFL